MDRWLLLFGSSGLQVVRTDLPLTSRPVGQPGVILGMSGRTACLLTGSQLVMVNVASGATNQYNLADSMSGQPQTAEALLARAHHLVSSPGQPAIPTSVPVPLQVALDGPMAYVTRGQGVLAINVGTGQRAFEAPWPDALAPPKTTPPDAATPATTGYVPGSTAYVPGMTGYSPSISWSPHMIQQGQSPQGAQVPPTIARAGRGVLYTLVSPTKVVALAQRGADGR